MSEEEWQRGIGDMSPDAFRAHGYAVVDWIAEYFEHAEAYPVLSRVSPGDIRGSLPESAPEKPEDMGAVLADFEHVVLPGITHWNHPGFFAYFSITGSGPGVLGEMLAAALNVNGMLWRTSPASTELEEVTLNWLRQMLGLAPSFEGVVYDTASISTLVAVVAARERKAPQVRMRGMAGGPRLRLYCSEHAHSSVEKAAITSGIGRDGVRKIGTDSEFRMDVQALVRAIKEDIAAGWTPFCVVATVGTTSSTSIDPVRSIAGICERHGLWLHVDGAYGGMAAILPEYRWILEGVDRADSLVVNPHKWLFTPIDLSVLYSRDMDTLRRAFSLVAEYLRTPETDVRNYMDYGPQLGRRFRALKLWFVLRSFGVDGIQARLRHHVHLAQLFAGWVDSAPDWELTAPLPFSTVCFRYTGGDATNPDLAGINEAILHDINAAGKVYLSHTVLEDMYTLRLAIGNLRTTEEHVRLAWDELQRAAETKGSNRMQG